MINNTWVSVCMVTFNQERFIAQAIESVLMQKGDFDLHLIIGDDASEDRTGDICKQYADRYPQKISYFRNETNLGPKLNFHKAMDMISGEYLAFCEGDDYWTDPNKLQKQIVFLQENREYNICFHKIKILLMDGRLVDDFITKIPAAVTTIDDLVNRNYIHTPSVVLRNNFTLPEWYWDCPIGDYPLYVLAVRNGKIKCLNESMAVYRHGVGIHSKLPPAKTQVLFFQTLYELIKNYPDNRIKTKLIRKQRRRFLFFLYKYFFVGKVSMKDLCLISSLIISSEKRHFKRRFGNDVDKKLNQPGQLIL